MNSSKSFAKSPLSDRSGYLDTPSADSTSDFAYNGSRLERLVFITPAFISVFMITFVTFWGARVSPALTVVFICCYVSYGWVKGIHSAVFSLFVGIEMSRVQGCKLARARDESSASEPHTRPHVRPSGPSVQVWPLTVVCHDKHSACSEWHADIGLRAKFESLIRVSSSHVQGATRNVAQNHWHSPRANVR